MRETEAHRGSQLRVRNRRRVLLLFNIAGPFDQRISTQVYKQNSWHIKHFRSVVEYIPKAIAARRRCLEHERDLIMSPFATGQDPRQARHGRFTRVAPCETICATLSRRNS